MANTIVSDRDAIQRLWSSPSFLRLADSILSNLDRKDLAKIIASYLYFKSRGRRDSDFVFFVVSEFPEIVFMAFRAGIPVIIPAVLTDKTFRALLISFAEKSLIGSNTS